MKCINNCIASEAWSAWLLIAPQIRRWCKKKWYDVARAEDIAQAGSIEFVRRFQIGDENRPASWAFQSGKSSCMDAAKRLGHGYWRRADRKSSEPEFVGIEIISELAAKQSTLERDERIDIAWQIVQGGSDSRFIAVFELLMNGYTQREASTRTGVSATRISEKLAAIGEKISGKRRIRKTTKITKTVADNNCCPLSY